MLHLTERPIADLCVCLCDLQVGNMCCAGCLTWRPSLPLPCSLTCAEAPTGDSLAPRLAFPRRIDLCPLLSCPRNLSSQYPSNDSLSEMLHLFY